RTALVLRTTLERRRAVGGKHRAREIERTGDEGARRRLEAEAADRGERGLDVIGALRGNADRARGVGDRVGWEAFLLTGDWYRHHAPGKPGEIPQKAFAVLGRKHADHEHERARHPLLEIAERVGDGAPAVRIVAAVEPELASRWAKRREPPVRETLHARRPFGLGNPGFERARRKVQLAHGAQRGDG